MCERWHPCGLRAQPGEPAGMHPSLSTVAHQSATKSFRAALYFTAAGCWLLAAGLMNGPLAVRRRAG